MKSLISLALLLTLAMIAAPALSQPAVYILVVKECAYSYWGGFIPEQFASMTRGFLESAARDLGVEVVVREVSSIEEWEKLMVEAPENVIIVNAHTHYVPVPPKYGLDWRSFLNDLTFNILNKGWIWVQPAGYGFYYFYYNFTKTETGWSFNTITVGEAGLQGFAANLGFTFSVPSTALVPVDASLMITDDGRKVFGALGYDIPDSLRFGGGGRYPVVSDATPEWYFYVYTGNFTAVACAAFRAGKGAVIWGGLGPGPAGMGDVAERVARVTTAMLLYYLYPEAVLQARRGALENMLQPTIIGIVAVVAVAIAAIILLRKKKLK